MVCLGACKAREGEEGSELRFPQLSRRIYSGLIFACCTEIEGFELLSLSGFFQCCYNAGQCLSQHRIPGRDLRRSFLLSCQRHEPLCLVHFWQMLVNLLLKTLDEGQDCVELGFVKPQLLRTRFRTDGDTLPDGHWVCLSSFWSGCMWTDTGSGDPVEGVEQWEQEVCCAWTEVFFIAG